MLTTPGAQPPRGALLFLLFQPIPNSLLSRCVCVCVPILILLCLHPTPPPSTSVHLTEISKRKRERQGEERGKKKWKMEDGCFHCRLCECKKELSDFLLCYPVGLQACAESQGAALAREQSRGRRAQGGRKQHMEE